MKPGGGGGGGGRLSRLPRLEDWLVEVFGSDGGGGGGGATATIRI